MQFSTIVAPPTFSANEKSRGNRNSRHDAEIIECVRAIFATYSCTRRPLIDRREDQRLPFPQLLRLMMNRAVGDEQFETSTITVVGKHLSPRGIDFYHQQPISDRHVVMRFENPRNSRYIDLALELTWCRFIRDHWYMSGGRFVRVSGNAVESRHQLSETLADHLDEFLIGDY